MARVASPAGAATGAMPGVRHPAAVARLVREVAQEAQAAVATAPADQQAAAEADTPERRK